jgi:cardiolipin synthase
MLVATEKIGQISVLPAVVILMREVLVSGLREYLAGIRVSVPVSRLAKWKTAMQMVALGVLIVGDAGPEILPVRMIGEVGLWIAALLTLVTGWDYLRSGVRHMAAEDERARQRDPAGKPLRSTG